MTPPGSLPFLPLRRVSWGAGALDSLPGLLRDAGAHRVQLLTTASLVVEARTLARVERALAGLLVARCAPLAAHVPVEGVEHVVAGYRSADADALVSLGGGSVVDAGKAAAGVLLDAGLPAPVHLALPTTLSGAELSHYYGITTTTAARSTKRSYARVSCTPDVVVYDPTLTTATPPTLWTSSGIKALDHAVEGLLARPETPVIDPLALDGITTLATGLAASTHPEALHHRLTCQLAAWQCFFAPAASTLGLSHRIGHVLGGSFGVPHGLTSCVTLAPVMRAMAAQTPERLAAITAALGVDPALDVSRPPGDPMRAGDMVEALVRSLGLPTRLRQLGVDPQQLPAVSRVLRDTYPHAAGQLGEDGDDRLEDLLRDIW